MSRTSVSLDFVHSFNFNDVLACLQKLDPSKVIPEDIESLGRDLSELDDTLGAESLNKFEKDGRTRLEESVEDDAGL